MTLKEFLARKALYKQTVLARLGPRQKISDVWPDPELRKLHREIVGTEAGFRLIELSPQHVLRMGFEPFACGIEGGRYGSDPIRFQVRNKDGNAIHLGEIAEKEYGASDLFANRIEIEREALEQKGFTLKPRFK